jgi:4'-phosphopantetheinyl transferase
MPLYKKIDAPGYSIGLWKIEEDLAFFEALFHGHPDIQHAHARLQWFASRHLANVMLGQPDTIIKDDSGKPNFKTSPQNISISHTTGFAAVMLSSKNAVGIDVEAIHPKIERIAHKFMQPEELAAIAEAEKLKKITLYWSAKEALFKLYGWGGIEFRTQLLIEPFEMLESGVLKANIETTHLPLRNLAVHYQFIDGHVLSYVAAG